MVHRPADSRLLSIPFNKKRKIQLFESSNVSLASFAAGSHVVMSVAGSRAGPGIDGTLQ